MARARGPNEASTYENQPVVPPELKKRFDLIRAVIGERTTISEAAKDGKVNFLDGQSGGKANTSPYDVVHVLYTGRNGK